MRPGPLTSLAVFLCVLGISAAGQTADEHYLKGTRLEQAGDLDGAKREFGSAIETAHDTFPAYVARAKIEAVQKDFDSAYGDATAAVQLRPDSPAGYYLRGGIRTSQRDFGGAIDDFDHALRLNPDSVAVLNDRGFARFLQHDLKGAIADYDQALALDGDASRTIVNRFYARKALGDIAGARADLERYIRLAPNSPYGYASRSELEWRDGQFDLAITDINRAIEMRPDATNWYYVRSHAELGKRDFAASLADLDRFLAAALPSNRGVPYARFFRRIDLIKLGRGGEDDLASQVARMEDSWAKSVGLYLVGGLPAEELIRRALVAPDKDRQRDQLCECHFYLGIVARFGGRLEDAKREYNACLETGQKKFVEYMLSKGELAELGN